MFIKEFKFYVEKAIWHKAQNRIIKENIIINYGKGGRITIVFK